MTVVGWLSSVLDMTVAGWLSLVLSIAAAVSARMVAQEATRAAGSAFGIATQPAWVVLAVTTGTWGFIYSAAYWTYTYLRIAGWWPTVRPAPRRPTPPRLRARRGRLRGSGVRRAPAAREPVR